jgi:hypothetical protein
MEYATYAMRYFLNQIYHAREYAYLAVFDSAKHVVELLAEGGFIRDLEWGAVLEGGYHCYDAKITQKGEEELALMTLEDL